MIFVLSFLFYLKLRIWVYKNSLFIYFFSNMTYRCSFCAMTMYFFIYKPKICTYIIHNSTVSVNPTYVFRLFHRHRQGTKHTKLFKTC